MDCLKARGLLSAYIDNMLEPQEKAQLERHVSKCVSCAAELAELKRYAQTMAALPGVKAPGDFLKKVHERIERRSEFESVIRGFFKPSAARTKAVVLVVTVMAMIGVYRVISPQFGPEFVMEKGTPDVRPEMVAMLREQPVADASAVAEKQESWAENLNILPMAKTAVTGQQRIGYSQDAAAAFTAVEALTDARVYRTASDPPPLIRLTVRNGSDRWIFFNSGFVAPFTTVFFERFDRNSWSTAEELYGVAEYPARFTFAQWLESAFSVAPHSQTQVLVEMIDPATPAGRFSIGFYSLVEKDGTDYSKIDFAQSRQRIKFDTVYSNEFTVE